MYITPTTEEVRVEAYAVLQSVSGSGLNDKGEDDGTHAAQAPSRILF